MRFSVSSTFFILGMIVIAKVLRVREHPAAVIWVIRLFLGMLKCIMLIGVGAAVVIGALALAEEWRERLKGWRAAGGSVGGKKKKLLYWRRLGLCPQI